MINQFLWVIYPYLCIAIFIIGHIARFKYDQFSWTAKSSELIEKEIEMGKLTISFRRNSVFFGHVVGLVIPKYWMDSLGVSEHMYHFGAVYIGSILV